MKPAPSLGSGGSRPLFSRPGLNLCLSIKLLCRAVLGVPAAEKFTSHDAPMLYCYIYFSYVSWEGSGFNFSLNLSVWILFSYASAQFSPAIQNNAYLVGWRLKVPSGVNECCVSPVIDF